MGQKYHPITNRLGRFLYEFIDRYDYGIMRPQDDAPWRQNTTIQLNSNSWGTRRITKTQIESHLLSDTRYYYTTRTSSSNALLMIDIDAHDGQFDAWDVAKWIIDNYFPGAYYERSTHGKGAHIYLVLRVGFIERKTANNLISAFSDSLAFLVQNEGFESRVCGVYGYYSIRTNGVILDGDRAPLGKIPRPTTGEDVEKLVNGPWYLWRALRTVAEEAEKEGSPAQSVGG